MTWKDKAHQVIGEAYLEFANATGKLPSPDLTDKEKELIMRIIKGSYPFGQREMWPYKVWCAEVRKVKAFLYPKKNEPINEGLFA